MKKSSEIFSRRFSFQKKFRKFFPSNCEKRNFLAKVSPTLQIEFFLRKNFCLKTKIGKNFLLKKLKNLRLSNLQFSSKISYKTLVLYKNTEISQFSTRQNPSLSLINNISSI